MCDSPTETGLYYLQSRYYDPEICRFINADGYASTGQGLLSGNAFAYCENSPGVFKDKTGYIRNYNVNMTDSGTLTLMCRCLIIAAHEEYSQKVWAAANKEQRKEILRNHMIEVAREMGIVVNSTIDYYNEKPTERSISWGKYYHSTRTISLNDYYLDDDGTNSFYLLSSVRHELRHSYQHYAIENSKTKVCGKQNQYVVGRKTLLEWEYCLKHYITPDEKIDDYQKQVIEYDARWFSGQLY